MTNTPKMPKFYLCLVLMMFALNTHAQQFFNIAEGPVYTMSCDSSCVMLNANYPKSLRSSAYSTSTINYAPQTITGTNLTLQDDKFSGAIPLGFDFCFYESVYNTCYISDNGVLTFNPQYANANCNNNTQQLFPYFNSTTPDNAIYFLFMDAAPQLGGSIKYATIGTAPNRKFVVTYEGMKIFGATCSNNTSTYQVVLSETTFMIEVFITNKVVCDASAANFKNYSTIGIQNIGVTNFVSIPNKHAAIFTGTNEGYRFSPSGPPNYQLTWYNQFNQVIATNQDSIYFCPPQYPYSKIRAKIDFFCPVSQFEDTVRIIKYSPSISSTTINPPPCPTDSSGSILITGTGTNPPFTYSINNSPYGSNNLFSGLSAGWYTLHIKDVSNCVKDTAIYLAAVNTPSVVIDSIHYPTCPDSTGYIEVYAINGVPPYQYTWSNGTIGPINSNLPGPSYTVNVVDASGCHFSLFIPLPPFGLPQVSISTNRPVCGDATGVILATASGAIPPYQYAWNTGANTNSVSNLSSGGYNVLVTDAIGCATTVYVSLLDTLVVLALRDSIATKCGLSNGSATVAPYNGLAPYTYAWSPSGQTASTAIGLPTGFHTCITTAANGCSRTDVIYVGPSIATINNISPANANCDTSNGKVLVTSVQFATPPIQYLWSTGAISQNIIDLPPGTYWVQTTDAKGCIDRDTVTLVNDGKPYLSILSYQPPTCHGDSSGTVTLSGYSGIAPYKYSIDGVNFQSFAQLGGIVGGTYPIYVSDANSCINDTLVTFSQPDKIILSFKSDTIVCFYDATAKVQYSATGGFPPYLFSFNNNAFGTIQTQAGLASGSYPISIQDSNNCVVDTTILVPGPTEELEIVIDKKDVPCYEDSTGYAHITIKGGWPPYQYVYSNPSFTGLMLNNLDVTNETIDVTDDRGCKVKDVIKITDNYCCIITVPNAFSPNNDGRNDRLRLITRSEFYDFKFMIYNRWGQRVYESVNHLDSWDGTLQNQPCDIGTFYYHMEYTCTLTNRKVKTSGDVTLVR